MHRSGTSAVAGAIEALGLTAGPPDHQLQSAFDNPAGFFELASVLELNTELLERLGGLWDCPPKPPRDWAAAPESEPALDRARELLAAEFGADGFVLKDPRLAILLPFWRRVLVDRCCAVLIVRDPAEVAWSLYLRDGIAPLTGLALWDTYNRSAAAGLEGLPVHICRYEELVEDPAAALVEMTKSLQRWGQIGADLPIEKAAASIDPQLRRNTWPRVQSDLADVPGEVRSLEKFLVDQRGPHDCFEPGSPPDVGWWVDPLIEERRAPRIQLRGAERTVTLLTQRTEEQEQSIAELHRAREMTAQAAAEAQLRLADVAAERDRALAELGRTATELGSARSEVARLTSLRAQLEQRIPVRLYRIFKSLIQR
jgi:hypothetical protein